jgi:hypothetical protein
MLVGVLPYIAVIFIAALLLARAFRRELGGMLKPSFLGLVRQKSPMLCLFSLSFLFSPRLPHSAGRVGVLERGIPIGAS